MRRTRTAAALAAGVVALSVALPIGPAAAAGGGILNGDFETDPVGSATITGWTAVDTAVDLGVTQLGGCTTVDTTSYDGLRDYAAEARPIPSLTGQVGPGDELYLPGTSDPVWLDDETGALTAAEAPGAHQIFYGVLPYPDGSASVQYYLEDAGGNPAAVWSVENSQGDTALDDGLRHGLRPTFPLPDPTVRQDTIPPVTDTNSWDEPPVFASAVVDAATAVDTGLLHSSQALEIRSSLNGSGDPGRGYVAHGGAAVSDVYTTAGPRSVSLDWAASALDDDFHVLGYVLDVDTCQQYEVLDATGESSDWQTATVDLPAAGHYRFVFVSGTYDYTWGTLAGAVLYIDDIKAVPVQVGTAVDVQPLFDVGHAAASAPVQFSGHGLAPGTDWTASLHSTPVEFADGITDEVGEFFDLTTLPATVEPGRHEIVLTGTAPDGSVREDRLWITVDATSHIAYVSGDGAQPTPPTPTPPGTTTETVTGAPDSTPLLANTGADPVQALVVAGALLAAGGAGLRLGRRRAA